MNKENAVTTTTFSLSGIGIVVGIVLSILQGLGTIDIGWFWATFAFWICPATELAIFLILFLGVVIFTALYKNK